MTEFNASPVKQWDRIDIWGGEGALGEAKRTEYILTAWLFVQRVRTNNRNISLLCFYNFGLEFGSFHVQISNPTSIFLYSHFPNPCSDSY